MLEKTRVDIIREKRYGEKGYNIVKWVSSGMNFYPSGGWISKKHLKSLVPKSRYKRRFLKQPHGHFGIPYSTKEKKFIYEGW